MRTDVKTRARGVSTAPGLFRNRYRIQSTRLPGWDYTSAAYYFVTLCTYNRAPVLGDVVDGRIELSAAGRIVEEEWRTTSAVRPHIMIDEYVVMPNHLHGIVVIQKSPPVETPRRGVSTRMPRRGVSTPRLMAGSLGAIIGQFKSVCTKRIREDALPDFGWQPRFYDHIIRDEESLKRIRQYIIGNPIQWQSDMDNPDNLWM